MPETLLAHGQRQLFVPGDLTRGRFGSIGLAIAIGLTYFLAAALSRRLLLEPEGVAVFWPAAGISSGVLIAVGLAAGWPVLVGVIVATVATHLIMTDHPLWAGVALGLCNAVEALIAAGLIQYYFGSGFNLVRLRYVFGLLAAAVAATIVSGIGGALIYRLMQGPSAPILTTWQHFSTTSFIGIVGVAPMVIGLAAVVRRPSPRSELIEGTLTLVVLGLMAGFIISLPRELWQTVLPITWLFPILAWLAARYRPAFSAAGAFVVAMTIVMTTILGKGYFGDPSTPITDRVLGAQAAILVVALSAYVLAALFAERRKNTEQLTRSNTMLERERDNKLMNAQAVTAAISHEVRQPLAAIAANSGAAVRFLGKTPPDLEEVRAALSRIVNDTHRTSEVFDGIRALFGKSNQERQCVDVNKIIVEVLQASRKELQDRGVETHLELASELPLVDGHRRQLEEVVLNLVHNAVEAMDATTDRDRVLRVRTGIKDHDAITVAVRDSGPGINPKQIDRIFGAFFSSKLQGMGLGLAICRMIIEHHGGHLTAWSDGKNGSLFQFVLPIESAEKGVARAKEAATAFDPKRT
jgi:signal transduction histidine kinase